MDFSCFPQRAEGQKTVKLGRFHGDLGLVLIQEWKRRKRMELIRHCAGKLNTLSHLILPTPQQAPASPQVNIITPILYPRRPRFRNSK